MVIVIVILSFLVIVWALEALLKRDCGRPGCKGWEWTNTGLCSDCCQPVIGNSKATRAWRKLFGDPSNEVDAVEDFFDQLKARRVEAKATALSQGESKTCPECLSVVPSGARVCRHCRLEFWG